MLALTTVQLGKKLDSACRKHLAFRSNKPWVQFVSSCASYLPYTLFKDGAEFSGGGFETVENNLQIKWRPTKSYPGGGACRPISKGVTALIEALMPSNPYHLVDCLERSVMRWSWKRCLHPSYQNLGAHRVTGYSESLMRSGRMQAMDCKMGCD